MGDGADAIHLPAARVLIPVLDAEAPRNPKNYRITDTDKLGVGSLKQKCRDNLAAITLLKELEGETRTASDEEKKILVRYVGWGGLPQVFDPFNKEWASQGEQLEKLLTPEEFESARATTLNAHYTAPTVIRIGQHQYVFTPGPAKAARP